MTDGPGADMGREEVNAPPTTGNPEIDEALGGLADLDSVPVAEHHDRLAEVQARLQTALETGSDLRRDPPDSG
jgi:hypothetical protein